MIVLSKVDERGISILRNLLHILRMSLFLLTKKKAQHSLFTKELGIQRLFSTPSLRD